MRVFIIALVALVVGAFNVLPTKVANPITSTKTSAVATMSAEFYDVGLDNMEIKEDKDAQPARKCATCFG